MSWIASKREGLKNYSSPGRHTTTDELYQKKITIATADVQFKYPDTFLLAASTVAYLVVGFVTWFWLGAIAVVPLSALLLLAIFALLLHQFRVREQQDVHQLRQIQALLTLYDSVSFEATPPWLTGWAATPELGVTIYNLVRERRPSLVLELGSGASTVIIGAALKQNAHGRLLSIDHEADYAQRTRREVERQELSQVADVIHAPIVSSSIDGDTWSWYDRSKIPEGIEIDLLVVDGPHRELQKMARYPALPVLIDRLAPNAVIVLDDAKRKDERRAVKRWMDMFDGLDVEFVDSPKGTAILRRSAPAEMPATYTDERPESPGG